MRFFSSKPYLYLELAALMVGLPLLAFLAFPPRALLPLLWAVTLVTYLVLRRREGPRAVWQWNWAAVNAHNVRPILLRAIPAIGLLAAATSYAQPQLLFSFVRAMPGFWAVVMVLYPILSVIPQEFIYRRFVFARYHPVLSNPRAMILVSAIGFGLAHIFLQNWVAPILSAVGGLMFATTYHRTRSLALASLEHALYGNAVFTLGLGMYFYHGAVP